MVTTLERRELIETKIELNPKAAIMRDGQAMVTVLRLNGSGDLLPQNIGAVVNGIRDAIEHGLGTEIKISRHALNRALWSNEDGEFMEDSLVEALIQSTAPGNDGVDAGVVDFLMNRRTFKAAIIEPNLCIIYDYPETPAAA